MKKILLFALLLVCFSSCKSSKNTRSKKTTTTQTTKNRISKKTKTATKAELIIDYAKTFEGVKYKWGGTTRAGMDCSGLVYKAFDEYNVQLPRISRDMAKRGEKIALSRVVAGDLVFFKISKKRNTINHVGLIISTENNTVKFIHSTTSRGVITSSMDEPYWKKYFVEARKVL
ncbi:MAG: C40 family peptidase [Aestuariibaculum sp.]